MFPCVHHTHLFYWRSTFTILCMNFIRSNTGKFGEILVLESKFTDTVYTTHDASTVQSLIIKWWHSFNKKEYISRVYKWTSRTSWTKKPRRSSYLESVDILSSTQLPVIFCVENVGWGYSGWYARNMWFFKIWIRTWNHSTNGDFPGASSETWGLSNMWIRTWTFLTNGDIPGASSATCGFFKMWIRTRNMKRWVMDHHWW